MFVLESRNTSWLRWLLDSTKVSESTRNYKNYSASYTRSGILCSGLIERMEPDWFHCSPCYCQEWRETKCCSCIFTSDSLSDKSECDTICSSKLLVLLS